jgi:hypothetical protein
VKGEYRKLPGRGRRFTSPRWLDVTASRSTVWLGSDHLLVVDDAGYSERYRRFPYADIQAIVVRRTGTYGTAAAVLALLAAVPLAGSFLTGEVGAWILRSLGGLFVLLLALHALRGPTCRTTLHTAVHVEEVPAWKRLRVARRGIARLRPFLPAPQVEPQPVPLSPT